MYGYIGASDIWLRTTWETRLAARYILYAQYHTQDNTQYITFLQGSSHLCIETMCVRGYVCAFMFLLVYFFVYLCISVCLCVRVCLCVYMCLFVCACVYLCMCVFLYVCARACLCMFHSFSSLYLCVRVRAHMYACMLVCVSLYNSLFYASFSSLYNGYFCITDNF